MFLTGIKMASFFGETLPVVSRAIDEDETSENPEQIISTKLVQEVECKSASNIFVFINCSEIANTEGFTLHVKIMQKLFSESSEEQCLGKVYHKQKSAKDSFIVVIDDFVSLSSAWKVKDVIEESCRLNAATKVFVFEALPKSCYTNNKYNEMETPLLKMISTTNKQTSANKNYMLEQPNMVKGVSAALLTYSLLKSVNCTVFLSFNNAGEIFDVNSMMKVVKNDDVTSVLNMDMESLRKFLHKTSLYI